MPGTGRLRVCAHRHRAHRQRRPSLHGRAHQFDVVVELPAVDAGRTRVVVDGTSLSRPSEITN